MSDRILCGMSGGVDSSVAACLLLQQGCQVTGCTMELVPREMAGSCGSSSDVEDARAVCRKLNIPLEVLDWTETFRQQVMQAFVDSYIRGETPNPCITCNRRMKFGAMLDYALERGLDGVATGHYAVIQRSGSRWLLLRAKDRRKDQTYFLYTLTQRQLSHTRFPLGQYSKEEIRALAEERGLANARKRDSQDICFVPNGDYGSFLERFTGQVWPKGAYLDRTGKVLGTHLGHIRYTLGQRKGLNIALGERAYVIGKDTRKNTVTLGKNEDLFSSELTARDMNLIACDSIQGELRCTVKLRHSQREAAATVIQTGEHGFSVRFDQPQRAVTPGQAAVLYDGEVVLGGGTIDHAEE